MKRLLSVAAILTVAASAAAYGAKLTTEDLMKTYEKTDKVEACIPLRSIHQTRILDKTNILFEMDNGRRYLNTLPVNCGGLTPYRAISYRTSLSQLCNTDIITVFEPGQPAPNSYGSCGLGKFTELKKKPETEAPKSE